ncbi:hypothetical protein V5O48_014790 [Marasmius crinis-equi]|uniref:Uncharacterized protein n=1 Tax=Marasmius crinis-equi TaxID=585013 RepID=A0ABR3EWB3_9AGAR
MTSGAFSTSASNGLQLSDITDAVNRLRLIPPAFTPVTCRPKTFENPAVGASTDYEGEREEEWHLVMKPKGCLLSVRQGIYREYGDIVAQLPEFKLEANSPIRYRKFADQEEAKRYWKDVCMRLHEHPEWNSGTFRRAADRKLETRVRQARCSLLFNEIAKLEPEVFSTSRLVGPLTSAINSSNGDILHVARLPMNGFRIYVLARVEDVLCCRPFEDLIPARDLHDSFIHQEIFSRLYLAHTNDEAMGQFEKDERVYSVAIEKALEGVDLSI